MSDDDVVKLVPLNEADKEAVTGDDMKAAIARLAEFDPIKYDQCRKQEAKRLGCRETTLDREVEKVRIQNVGRVAGETSVASFMRDPELWPHEVEGGELLDRMVTELERYAVFPSHSAEAVALWTMFAHCHDAARHSPLLALTSPTKRCGKTTVLNLIRLLVPKPLPASNASTASVFRAIEKYQPTLLVDEAETFLNANEDLRGILNAGQFREQAFVLRAEGEDHEPKLFSVWAPKVLALIGKLPDTLEDRSINITLRRKTVDEDIAFFDEAGENDLVMLCQEAARWAADNVDHVKRGRPDFPDKLKENSRTCDNWRTIISIADLIGGTWRARARIVALAISGPGVVTDETPGIELLQDIKNIFQFYTPPVERLYTSTILNKLINVDSEARWSDWRHGKPLSGNAMGRLLKPFGITSSTMRIDGGDPAKGYHMASFEDAWACYLPNIEDSIRYSVTNGRNPGVSSENPSVTNTQLLRMENTEKPQSSGVCNAVTDEMSEIGSTHAYDDETVEREERRAIQDH